MFADDICVFCPSVRGLQSTLVCQAYAESHGIIFNCSKTGWRLGLWVQKAQTPHYWH